MAVETITILRISTTGEEVATAIAVVAAGVGSLAFPTVVEGSKAEA